MRDLQVVLFVKAGQRWTIRDLNSVQNRIEGSEPTLTYVGSEGHQDNKFISSFIKVSLGPKTMYLPQRLPETRPPLSSMLCLSCFNVPQCIMVALPTEKPQSVFSFFVSPLLWLLEKKKPWKAFLVLTHMLVGVTLPSHDALANLGHTPSWGAHSTICGAKDCKQPSSQVPTKECQDGARTQASRLPGFEPKTTKATGFHSQVLIVFWTSKTLFRGHE